MQINFLCLNNEKVTNIIYPGEKAAFDRVLI